MFDTNPLSNEHKQIPERNSSFESINPSVDNGFGLCKKINHLKIGEKKELNASIHFNKRTLRISAELCEKGQRIAFGDWCGEGGLPFAFVFNNLFILVSLEGHKIEPNLKAEVYSSIERLEESIYEGIQEIEQFLISKNLVLINEGESQDD